MIHKDFGFASHCVREARSVNKTVIRGLPFYAVQIPHQNDGNAILFGQPFQQLESQIHLLQAPALPLRPRFGRIMRTENEELLSVCFLFKQPPHDNAFVVIVFPKADVFISAIDQIQAIGIVYDGISV